MSLVNKIMDLMTEFDVLGIRVTELTMPGEKADEVAQECCFPFRPPTAQFKFNGAKIVVTKPKHTEKQQLIDRLRACADQLEKSE